MARVISLVITLSFVANLVMAAILLRPEVSVTQNGGGNASRSRSSPALQPARRTPSASSATAGSAAQRTQVWKELAPLTPAELRERLRAAGFPKDVVAAIIHARLQMIYLSPLEEEMARGADVPYWKNPFTMSADLSTRRQEAYRKIAAEEQALTRADGWKDIGVPGEPWMRAIGVPEEKYAAVRKIQIDYEQMQKQISSNPSDPDVSRKLAMLQAEERSDLEKVLTKEELFDYDLRTSMGATILRHQTEFFPLSETEFRTLAPVFIDAFKLPAGSETLTATARAKLFDQALANSEEKLRALMGDERFADFQQARDPESAKLNRIVKRLDLPLSAAREVVGIREAITSRADAVKTDSSLTPEQKSAQLTSLAQEAEQRISSTLSPRGLAAYKQYDGRWLQALQTAGGASK